MFARYQNKSWLIILIRGNTFSIAKYKIENKPQSTTRHARVQIGIEFAKSVLTIMKCSCGSGATPALSNVWCTLLAKKQLQQKRAAHHHHHHVPISLEDCTTIIWRQPETKCLESAAHYLQLMSMAGRSVQRARRPRPQKPQRRPPDIALEWAASVRASSNVALPPPAAVTSLNISVLIVSLRFDPHAPCDPQLAMESALALTPPAAACPATRADSQRKFHTLTHCWPCALRGQL